MPVKDLQAFLPALGINIPKGASLTAGMLNSDLEIIGPTNKLVITGNIGLFNGKLAGFDLGSKMSAVTALTGIKTGSDLLVDKLTSDIRMAPEGLKADNFIAVLPQLGNLTGAGTADAKNNLDFKMVATLSSAQSASGGSSADTGGGGLGGLLSRVAGGGCKSGLTVPFQIKGTTADPKFVPDVGGLAAGMFKSKLGCMGGSSTTASGQSQADPNATPTNPVETISGLFKKKKP
jgi:hypothetical protein